MNDLFYKKFYGQPCVGDDRSVPTASELVAIRANFENSNPVVSVLFNFAENNGCLPNDIDMSLSKATPEEFKSVLTSIQRKFPTIQAFQSDDDAFQFVADRYAQFGDEVEPYIQFLNQEVDKLKQPVEEQPNPE